MLNKLQKQKLRKERLNRKKNKKSLPVAQGEAQPAQAHPLPLSSTSPRTQAARWNATELLEHAEDATVATCPSRAFSSRHAAPGRAVRPFPPSRALLLSSSPQTRRTRDLAGAPTSSDAATKILKASHGVHRAPRRRLHRSAEGIDPGASVDDARFISSPPWTTPLMLPCSPRCSSARV